MLTKINLVVLFGCSLLVSGCGGGGGSSTTPPRAVILGEITPVEGVTAINQSVVATDGDPEVFPGHANNWDIGHGFALRDGGDDQFDDALEVSVVVAGGLPADFINQARSELTWLTPLSGVGDGLVGAAVADASFRAPVAGANTAYLTYATGDTRLRQTLDLTSATGIVTLTWAGSAMSDNVDIFESEEPNFQVALRDIADDSVLATLYSNNPLSGTFGTADITAFAGTSVMLSFEATGSGDEQVNSIDSVSVQDGTAMEFVSNGDFESGLAGWTSNVVNTSTNFVSGVLKLNGLDVQRSFYTVPNKKWGRWVDVYENNTAAPITATINYDTDVGSDGRGVFYFTPGTSEMAITSWDATIESLPDRRSDRDFGMVYGMADAPPVLVSAPVLDASGSTSDWTVPYTITVLPGERATIVNFIVMNGNDTSLTAVDTTALATDIDNVVKAIVDGFGSDPQYQDGMTQAQIDSIINL